MADPNLILSSQYPIPSALQLYRIYALLTVRARWVPEAQRNEPAEIQRLIAAGVNPSTANGVGQTPLHVACLWGNHECVKVLIESGALVTSLFLVFRPMHPHHTFCLCVEHGSLHNDDDGFRVRSRAAGKRTKQHHWLNTVALRGCRGRQRRQRRACAVRQIAPGSWR